MNSFSRRSFYFFIFYYMSTIHGQNGQHAQDLITRWLISPESTGEQLIIVPITQTTQKIIHLLDTKVVKQPEIVNFAGVMTTSPSAIANLHFLFGPWITTDLKVAVAWPKTLSIQKILNTANNQWIRIIETTRTEHDRKMAVIQWLSHLVLILIWERWDERVHSTLIKPWKTPTNTIVDMIFANPFAEDIAIEFFELLPRNNHNPLKTFKHIVTRHLTWVDRINFSTPNFDRIISFWDQNIHVILPKQVEKMRENLNSIGRSFLEKKINEIRTKS